jgi:concanavalin A-like lectin/glucanase superfamily protein/VCBS repeat protein
MGGLLHVRRFAARGFGLRRSGYSTSTVTLVAALALVFTTVSTTPAASAVPEPPCTTAEATVVAAAVMAKRCGTKVEISTLRSETEQTFAKPLGGYTTERSMEPRWARKPDGSWTGIDTALRVSGGVVSPVASALPVEFSAGGGGPAARVRSGDRELAITWPFGALPAPTLSGSAATYAEVLPGVDLTLTASPVGFSEVLVVKTAQAALNPKLAKVMFGFATRNVTAGVTAAGGVEAKDNQGRVVFTSPTPLMWDSAPAPGVAKAKAAGEAVSQRRVATMPVTTDNGELVVTPDAAMIADTTTRYPVFIDPSWSGRLQNNAWTLVSSKLSDSAFWQGGGFLQNAADIGAVGTGLTCDSYSATGACLSPTYNVRSYFQMDVSAMKGKSISGASFRIEQRWAWGCGNGGSSATVRVTNDIGGGTTWNNQPQWWGNEWASSSPANHKLGALHNCAGPGDVEFEMTGVVRHAAAANWDFITFVIHVGDENVVDQWKRFNEATPVLAIDYNSLPNVPDTLTVDGKPCVTGVGRPFTPTVTPTLRARFSDPDPADAMDTRFEWARVREDGSYTPVSETRDLGGRANGTISETTLQQPAGLPSGVLDGSETIVGAGDWDGDGRSDVLAKDSAGYLYLFPGDAAKVGTRVLIGMGWGEYTVAGIVDWDKDGKADIIAKYDSTGEVFVYPGENKRGFSSQPRGLIGVGFGPFTFAGVSDWDKDGKADLLARHDGSGDLYLFPGENKRALSTQPAVVIGTGWGGGRLYGTVDRTGDGAPDLVAQFNNDGVLWLYPGSGARTQYAGTPFRFQIGSGWANATVVTTPDFNGGGATDMVAQLPGLKTWWLYPGVVGTGMGGAQWPIAGLGVADGSYAFRATAGDGHVWGAASGWCEFSVDVTAPDAPTVTASIYKPTGCPAVGCGSLGVADTFTFASTSTDVVKYRWGFTDPPAMTVTAPSMGAAVSVAWTPPSAGPKTLYVDAVDRAGLPKRTTYQFTVATPTRHSGQWLYGDVPGSDTSGSGHDLTLVGVAQGLPGRARGGFPAVGFNGTTATTATAVKVLDTSRDFTASAWVRLTGDAVDRTVISQQGTSTSAFRLGYVAAQHKWAFSLAETDTANATQRQVLSDTVARTGVWTHLTAVYESSNREVRLYVDGALQRETTVVTAGFNAAGGLWIGRRLLGGAVVEPWQGELEKVRVWGRAITPQEVVALIDPVEVSRVGWWPFNESAGQTALDLSRFAHDLTLTLAPGATWGAGHERGGLHLDGTGSAQSNESVLNTDQSFSVDVWARLVSRGVERTVLVQRGPSGVDPFTLRYDGTRWSADMPNASSNPTTWWRAKSTADATVNTWTHLVVTYDASAQTLSLWVDDSLQNTVTGVVGWNHDGLLTVGRSSAGAFWLGDIDELNVFQTVLTPKPVTTSAPTGASVSGDAFAEIINVRGDGVVSAYRNTQGGYPEGAVDIGSGWTPERTWFADLNADGRTEIIGLDADGTIRAFPNINGMNGFPFGSAMVVGKASSPDPSRLRFADLDGDGRADRVSLDADGRVRVYRNLFGLNSSGQSSAFSATPVIVTVTTAAPNKVRLADVDGDHKAEFITINDDGTVWGYRNLSGLEYGTFDGYQEIGSGWTPERTWFADITGDGRAEIVTVRTDGTVWSFPNINALNGFPFGYGVLIGSGWNEPARVFFS